MSNESKNNKRHLIFNFFSGSSNRSGRGVSKKDVERDKRMGFAYFFKLLKNKLGKFSGANLIFALCNFPFFIALVGFVGMFDSSVNTASDPLYANLFGAMQYESNPVIGALKGIIGAGTDLRVISDTSNVLMYFAYALILTFGISSVGMIYNMRNVCLGNPVDTWHDYFDAIKKNLRQAIPVGIIDTLIIALLIYDLIAYRANSENGFLLLVLYYATIAFAAIYYIMRIYVYIQLVTCNMTVGKMFKNAFLLTALGIKRNLIAVIVSLAFIVLFVYVYLLLPSVAIILFSIFVFAFLAFIAVYCAYPVVERYVIEPYYEDHPEERPGYGEESDLSEPVFTDRD